MMLQKIKLKNIRSYQECEIEFPQGSFLLSGDIGSGKTTILLAIEYALFGLQPGQRGSALLRNNTDFGEVSLEFEIDGHSIILERKLKRSQNAINNDYSAISIDGNKLELSATELKTRVISLLGYPSEFVKKNNLLYRYTVYTPQEHMKQVILGCGNSPKHASPYFWSR
jgi:exonuclease SbcC